MRFWPSGLTWRIVIVVLLGVVLVQAIGFILFIVDRRDRADELIRTTARQIVATTELYDVTPPEQRALVLRAVTGPLLRARATSDLEPLASRGWEPAPFWVASSVRARLAPLAQRDIRIHIRGPFADHEHRRPPWREHHRDGADQRFERATAPFEPSRRRLAVSVPLDSGGWLTFLVASDVTSLRWVLRTSLFWAATLVVVLVVTLWASRRLARPFQRFADAADRLGTDLNAPPLAEAGSGELRGAIAAFNRMQARIRRMVGDRTMMLAAIGHDLRTVLTRLRLRAEMIDDANQRARAEADLDEMQAMLEGTLTFVRGEAADSTSEPLDLAALLQTIADDAADAGGNVSYLGPNRCPAHGRPLALRRLFQNLVDNALRFGKRATLRLDARADALICVVEDDGPGIPPGERERVFEPFYRLDGSRSRATGGVGLGLAIARSMARAHGGDIVLEAAAPSGLRAVVSLPRGPASDAASSKKRGG